MDRPGTTRSHAATKWLGLMLGLGCAALGVSCHAGQVQAARVKKKGPPQASRLRLVALGAKARLRLKKLRLRGCAEQRLIDKQSFALRSAGTPRSHRTLAVFTCGAAAKVRFVLLGQGHVRHVLVDHPANAWAVDSVDAVALRDVDGDGVSDLIAIVSAMSGAGPGGAQAFAVAGFWLGTKDGTFRADPRALSQLSGLRKITVRSVTRKLQAHYRSTRRRSKR